jgi:glycosyltransferase involved in cell wall biosynthesis
VSGELERVAHLDTGREWRGGQAQVFLLARGLTERGIDNVVIAPPGPLLERARQEGWTTIAWHARGDWDLAALLAARGALRRLAPDVAHCHSARAHALGVPAARLAGVRAVVVSRRVAFPIRPGLKYRMPVDRYLCVSQGVARAMRAGGVPAERLAVVPSGIVPDRGAPAADLRALIGVPTGALLVGTVAALTAEKRHEDLIEAAVRMRNTIPEAHFVWVGEGPRRGFLERLRRSRGLENRIHLLGFRLDAAGLMAQCTVVALASDSEGIATSLLDAQAAGVPVVATAVGGIPEVVQDRVTGRLVPARQPAALAAALVEILTDPELRLAMARAGAEWAKEFHIDRTVERTLEEYRAVLRRRDNSA